MSAGRRVHQLVLDGTHAYAGPVAGRIGYRATCSCGWISSRRDQPRTKAGARGLWRSHATTEVGRGV